jgi:hypothetical protein
MVTVDIEATGALVEVAATKQAWIGAPAGASSAHCSAIGRRLPVF